MSFERLLEPIKIRGLELSNRVVMSAMGTHESGESESKKDVTDKLIAYHVARAKGGCALNTVEVCAVDEYSAPAGFLSLGLDQYVAGHKKLNDAVHAVGGKTCVQLWQGGLAVASDQTVQILLPNDMPLTAEYTVPGITEERLLSVVAAFGAAAKRAVEAGYDTVEFHCAHNYLPHSMLSGGINHRTDSWGGSFENREKFPLMCIKAIRENIPEDMPLFMRVDCHDDFLEGGLTIEEVIAFCKDAKEAGVDVLNVSRGNILTAATVYEVAPVDIPNCFNVEDAARIRRETGMLTMPCGRINYPEQAEAILEADKADLVVMARAQLADAEFVNKVREGKLNDIKYCMGCNQGCYDYFTASLYSPLVKHISCMRNPALLEEDTLSLTATTNPKKVVVIGGGVAGIEAAVDLKKTGNDVVLYEASDKLGGQFNLAGVAPGKSDFNKALGKMVANVEELGIDVRLNTVADEKAIEGADAVVIAVGSNPVTLRIEGAETTVQAHEILKGKLPEGKNAVIIGGGLVGFETAELLASKGVASTILEMREKMFTDLGALRQITAQFALAQMPIKTETSTTVKAVRDGKVVADKNGEEVCYEADYVVMAVGSRSLDSENLQKACKDAGVPVYVVGDANKAGLALTAIHEAYRAVLDINSK